MSHIQCDFKTCLLSQELIKQSISYFYHIFVPKRGCVVSNFGQIEIPIWPPGGHLGFSLRELNLENHLSIQFAIFIIDWYLFEDVFFQNSSRSKIQYGRQAAIFDFSLGAI